MINDQRLVPSLPGVLDAAQVRRTGDWLAQMQHTDGAMPWFDGGHIDPWDHVEAAMGLTVAGRYDEAVAAYEWSRRTQRADGSWPIKINSDHTVADAGVDANFTSYIAVGVWHHWLSSGDDQFLNRMWPVVDAALNKIITMRTSRGLVAWAEDAEGRRFDEALVTGTSSVFHALTAGLALADERGVSRPAWEQLRQRLGRALESEPEAFAGRSRYSMDWYYPVLGGALNRTQALARIEPEWDRFVVSGYGIRCVDDHPWVTGAETAELAISLAGIGEGSRAQELLAAVQHLRDPNGGYWTGLVLRDQVRWPVEMSTWTAAAILLAVDAVTETTAGHRVHRALAQLTSNKL